MLFVAGEIDLVTAPLLLTAVNTCARRPVQYVDVDVSGIRFCDVTGLNVFLESARVSAARGCRLRLRRPAPQLRRLLDLTSTTAVLVQAPAPSQNRRAVILPSMQPRRRAGRRMRRSGPGRADAQ
ncbi:STAS domain-containing protein [Streptomyces sp. NPDC050535]|uniref:STAS domain-containing protein n=1 Tax=Streptomyces sp. NPDC050535 TaxID=3365626 RepID=UPI00379CEA55